MHRVFDDLKEYERHKIHKSFRDWNIGSKCRKMYKNLSSDEQCVFKAAVSTAFTTAAAYMQKKFPINKIFEVIILGSKMSRCRGGVKSNDQEKNLLTNTKTIWTTQQSQPPHKVFVVYH